VDASTCPTYDCTCHDGYLFSNVGICANNLCDDETTACTFLCGGDGGWP
jgi:hypothetical protein